MPSTGTPSVKTTGGALGGCVSVTDSGPPERITPRGLSARTSSSVMSQGWISQYTPSSRTRRAMSCVYCAPKSRIRMRSAWISAWGVVVEGVGLAALAIGAYRVMSGHPVIGRLFGDAHVVYVAFAHACARDADEDGTGAHIGDVRATRV